MSDTPGQPGPSSQPQPPAGPSKAASSWKPQYSETGPGPSLQTYRRHPERAYGGPNPDSLSNARTPEQAEQYWKRVRAVEGPPLPRFGRLMGIGGWVLSGIAVFYMVAYADFGDKEHVFSETMAQVYEQHVHAVREGAQYDGPGEAAQVPGSGAGEGLDCTTPMARFGSSHASPEVYSRPSTQRGSSSSVKTNVNEKPRPYRDFIQDGSLQRLVLSPRHDQLSRPAVSPLHHESSNVIPPPVHACPPASVFWATLQQSAVSAAGAILTQANIQAPATTARAPASAASAPTAPVSSASGELTRLLPEDSADNPGALTCAVSASVRSPRLWASSSTTKKCLDEVFLRS
ncbi:hypothetical protein A1Q2_03440 [Trichosporon asahii var. asahii CBS 8904]|uniref:Uncharacterized protein n=1 Tax=Trichosporon asahii var. asahii (strain CBS 8904) TaxID=1220162 RepID=K1VZR1_TRIAC|nr:hypothetical protein A1Q2_03440 [Trichosporon asahii var. asahii CBS 8904]